MALQAFTIHSHYESKDEISKDEIVSHDPAEGETQWTVDGDGRLPPKFVAARLPVDEYGRHAPLELDPSKSIDKSFKSVENGGFSVADWYKSLKRTTSSVSMTPRLQEQTESSLPQATISESSKRSRTSTMQGGTRPNWFSPSYTPSTSRASTPASETIADRLSRDPPKLQGSHRRAPVWLALGPSNKGYEMLASKGWKEGEGLGARAGIGMKEYLRGQERLTSNSAPASISGEGLMNKDVIDLTLSSDEEGIEEEESFDDVFRHSRSHTPLQDETDHALPSGGISLITPLPTVLKSDKRGIGISTKYTVLPSGVHVPNRRITHGEKALAAHLHSMELARRHRLKWGKGRNGYKRKAKAEALHRQQLLAYMNG